MTTWLAWTPAAAATLHIIEEFVVPGGFAEWDRRYRPQITRSITPRFHVIVNALLLFACYDAAALSRTRVGGAVWLTVVTLLFTNGVWHVAGSVRTRSYSPGVVTSVLLYAPLGAYGYAQLLRSGAVSPAAAVLTAAIGSSYQLWIGKALHARRARRVKP